MPQASTAMEITAVRATPVRVPRPAAFTSSLGVQQASGNAVVEVETDGGLLGLGVELDRERLERYRVG